LNSNDELITENV